MLNKGVIMNKKQIITKVKHGLAMPRHEKAVWFTYKILQNTIF